MMKPLDCLSEPMGAFGGVTADGMINVLGRPKFDQLTLVLREAVQNTWDARVSKGLASGAIPDFRVRIRTLENSQAVALRHLLGDAANTTEAATKNELRGLLASAGPIRVLELADFGTVGLRGPVDPRQPLETMANNFMNFFFDVGVSHVESGDGGTYGYGRSALYLASRARTILVDTLVPEGAHLERRFLGCRIGHAYERKGFVAGGGARFTGRHFWGRRSSSDAIRPVLDAEATKVAEALGMPRRTDASSTGTTIMIPWPESDSDPISGHWISQVLLRHLWPKMVTASGPKAMRFSVEEEGRAVAIPSVLTHRVYGLFASALLAARARGGNSQSMVVALQKPDIVTGHLGLEVGSAVNAVEARSDEMADKAFLEFEDGLHHVALMRPSELVVRYLDVPNARRDERQWAGAFLCSEDEEVRAAFATAEPPAHDDWIADRIDDKAQRRLVNRTVSHLIPNAVKQRFGMFERGSTAEAGPSLAAAADAFGREFFIGDGTGFGGKPQGARPLPPAQGRVMRVKGPTFRSLMVVDGARIAVFSVVVAGLSGRHARVSASAAVVGDNIQGNDQLVSGVKSPDILGWATTDGLRLAAGAEVQVDSDGELLVEVVFHGDYALEVACTIMEAA